MCYIDFTMKTSKNRKARELMLIRSFAMKRERKICETILRMFSLLSYYGSFIIFIIYEIILNANVRIMKILDQF